MSSRFIMPFADVGSGIKPSSGAKLFFFETDGVTPKDTFSDQLSTPTPNTNPAISDSNGVFSDIYISGDYKVTLKDKNDSLKFSLAEVSEVSTGDFDTNLINDLSQVYEFATVALYKAFTTAFPTGKTIKLLDRGAEFTVIAGTGTANTFDIIASTEVSQSINLTIDDGVLRTHQLGAKSDGSDEKDLLSRFFALLNSTVREGVIGPLTIATSLPYSIDRSDVTLSFEEDAYIKALAVMQFQITIGDGVNRKQSIHIISPKLKGESLASYGIKDFGTRISSIKNGIFEDHIEFHIIQEPTTADFSEFLDVIGNQGFDAKGLFIHKATATSKATDTVIQDNKMFRPTGFGIAHITSGQRFKIERNMCGSQTATYSGGVFITASNTYTQPNTAEHIINDLYVESNIALGSGIESVVIENQSTTNVVNGCVLNDIKVEPASVVAIARISGPAAGGSRQHTITGIDPKGGFANSIIIGSNVAYTRIGAKNADNNLDAFINDNGIGTAINGLIKIALGVGTIPNRGAVGDIILNTSDGSKWLTLTSSTWERLSFGIIEFQTTFNPASIAAGATLETNFAVTGVLTEHTPLVTLQVNMVGLMMTAYTVGGALRVVLFNPTAGAIDLGSHTLIANILRTAP